MLCVLRVMLLSSGAKIAAHAAPLLLGLGKRKPTEWNTLVAKVRKEKGLTLKETLKYIKEHNLYQKKGKTGGSLLDLPLTDESVAANLRDMMPPYDANSRKCQVVETRRKP
jgi:hypothetical protein